MSHVGGDVEEYMGEWRRGVVQRASGGRLGPVTSSIQWQGVLDGLGCVAAASCQLLETCGPATAYRNSKLSRSRFPIR